MTTLVRVTLCRDHAPLDARDITENQAKWKRLGMLPEYCQSIDHGLDAAEATHATLVELQQPKPAAALGAIGGRATTEAKSAASRDNGKKGGRPALSCDCCGTIGRTKTHPESAARFCADCYKALKANNWQMG